VRLAWVLLLGGCQAIYGLKPPDEAPPLDARYFDAHLDAPWACPSTGAPAFNRAVNQAYVQPCENYNETEDGSISIAMCDAIPSQRIGTATSLVHITAFEGTGENYFTARISPEGDALYVFQRQPFMAFGGMAAYMRDGDQWVDGGPGPTVGTFPAYAQLGVPTRGPRRHIMFESETDALVHELVFDDTGTTEAHSYSTQDLGTDYPGSAPNLSPDGLRMVFTAAVQGVGRVLYATRATIDDAFTTTYPVDTVDDISDAFVTPDCARLYFTAVGSVLYVKG
jgi:hypothetical protein